MKQLTYHSGSPIGLELQGPGSRKEGRLGKGNLENLEGKLGELYFVLSFLGITAVASISIKRYWQAVFVN